MSQADTGHSRNEPTIKGGKFDKVTAQLGASSTGIIGKISRRSLAAWMLTPVALAAGCPVAPAAVGAALERPTEWDILDWVLRWQAAGGFVTAQGFGWNMYGHSAEDRERIRSLRSELDLTPERRDRLELYSDTLA